MTRIIRRFKCRVIRNAHLDWADTRAATYSLKIVALPESLAENLASERIMGRITPGGTLFHVLYSGAGRRCIVYKDAGYTTLEAVVGKPLEKYPVNEIDRSPVLFPRRPDGQ